jgi:hypothetical protein
VRWLVPAVFVVGLLYVLLVVWQQVVEPKGFEQQLPASYESIATLPER